MLELPDNNIKIAIIIVFHVYIKLSRDIEKSKKKKKKAKIELLDMETTMSEMETGWTTHKISQNKRL